jgi:IS5 family transposase
LFACEFLFRAIHHDRNRPWPSHDCAEKHRASHCTAIGLYSALPQALFTAINADLAARGLLLREGTLVDATLVAAPSSTTSEKRARDPALHQTKKGNQWYFRLNAHIDPDRDGTLVHSGRHRGERG